MSQIIPTDQRVASVQSLFEGAKPQLQDLLPKGLTPERFLAVALKTVSRRPDLLQCTPASLIASLLDAATMGLEVDGLLGHAYLVPQREKGVPMAALRIGYKGFVALARSTGDVRTVEAVAVYEGDEFAWEKGLAPKLTHKPVANDRSPEKLTHVYAIIRWAGVKRGEAPDFEVMTRAQVDAIRRRSRASDQGPWVTDYEAMALKTVVRNLANRGRLPLGSAGQKVAMREELQELGVEPVEVEVEVKPSTPRPDALAALMQQTPQRADPPAIAQAAQPQAAEQPQDFSEVAGIPITNALLPKYRGWQDKVIGGSSPIRALTWAQVVENPTPENEKAIRGALEVAYKHLEEGKPLHVSFEFAALTLQAMRARASEQAVDAAQDGAAF